jgi:hypothetical protein
MRVVLPGAGRAEIRSVKAEDRKKSEVRNSNPTRIQKVEGPKKKKFDKVGRQVTDRVEDEVEDKVAILTEICG